MTDSSPRPDERSRQLRFSPIYPIIDVDFCRVRGIDPAELAGACARGGATVLQVRQKSGGSGPFLSIVREIVRRTRDAGVAVIVNDRADLAKAGHAHGVHVGQDDLPVDAVRAIAGRDAIVGLSTHTREQVDAARNCDVDYVAVGPVFGTTTKETGYTARGLELVRYAGRPADAAEGRRHSKPVVAIGGITIEGAAAVRQAGADAVAVISDLLTGGDPERRVRDYLRVLGI